MPRIMAPPPSGEFSIVLTQPFGETSTTQKIEFIGEPNRPSNVKVTRHLGKDLQNIEVKTGSIQADDTTELLDLTTQLSGFPSNPDKDVYGLDTRLTLTTFKVQWDNAEETEGVEGEVMPTEENKQNFKDVVDSVRSLARQSAK